MALFIYSPQNFAALYFCTCAYFKIAFPISKECTLYYYYLSVCRYHYATIRSHSSSEYAICKLHKILSHIQVFKVSYTYPYFYDNDDDFNGIDKNEEIS